MNGRERFFKNNIFPTSGVGEERKVMTKKSLMTSGFLSGLFLLFLIAPQGAQASSSALTSIIDYQRMTAAVNQDINAGRVVGNYLDSSQIPADHFHNIFATPVPELIAMLLLGFVLNALWGSTRRLRRN
jgi:hypothetical protein